MKPDDGELWQRVRRGDAEAFGCDQQEVFVLCGWLDVSYEDAASALEIPVGTVRSRLSRARTRLRELEPGFGHEENDLSQPVREVAEP